MRDCSQEVGLETCLSTREQKLMVLDVRRRTWRVWRTDYRASCLGSDAERSSGRTRNAQGAPLPSRAFLSSLASQTGANPTQSYFLSFGNADIPVIYKVDRLRDGRSYSTRSVLASQLGVPIFTLTCSFCLPEPKQPTYAYAVPSWPLSHGGAPSEGKPVPTVRLPSRCFRRHADASASSPRIAHRPRSASRKSLIRRGSCHPSCGSSASPFRPAGDSTDGRSFAAFSGTQPSEGRAASKYATATTRSWETLFPQGVVGILSAFVPSRRSSR